MFYINSIYKKCNGKLLLLEKAFFYYKTSNIQIKTSDIIILTVL
jgi:hypothetical protein